MQSGGRRGGPLEVRLSLAAKLRAARLLFCSDQQLACDYMHACKGAPHVPAKMSLASLRRPALAGPAGADACLDIVPLGQLRTRLA